MHNTFCLKVNFHQYQLIWISQVGSYILSSQSLTTTLLFVTFFPTTPFMVTGCSAPRYLSITLCLLSPLSSCAVLPGLITWPDTPWLPFMALEGSRSFFPSQPALKLGSLGTFNFSDYAHHNILKRVTTVIQLPLFNLLRECLLLFKSPSQHPGPSIAGRQLRGEPHPPPHFKAKAKETFTLLPVAPQLRSLKSLFMSFFSWFQLISVSNHVFAVLSVMNNKLVAWFNYFDWDV